MCEVHFRCYSVSDYSVQLFSKLGSIRVDNIMRLKKLSKMHKIILGTARSIGHGPNISQSYQCY